MKIKATIEKVPGGMMVIPLIPNTYLVRRNKKREFSVLRNETVNK